MPAQVLDAPLGIACVFSSGVQVVKLLGEVPDAVLARELLVGLAGLVHPHGPLNSKKSVITYLTVVRALSRGLDGVGHRGGLAELTRVADATDGWGAAQCPGADLQLAAGLVHVRYGRSAGSGRGVLGRVVDGDVGDPGPGQRRAPGRRRVRH